MPDLRYAFVQLNNNIHCFLKRNNNIFDRVIFDDKNFLRANDLDFWKKWARETAFCESMDIADLLFILPEKTNFPYKIIHSPVGTSWTENALKSFISQKIGFNNISGAVFSSLKICGVPYRMYIRRSSVIANEDIFNNNIVVMTVDSFCKMCSSVWFGSLVEILKNKPVIISFFEVNNLNNDKSDESKLKKQMLNKYRSLWRACGTKEDKDLNSALCCILEKVKDKNKEKSRKDIVFVTNQSTIASDIKKRIRNIKRKISFLYADKNSLEYWQSSNKG
ncbi:MAG: hypothetical protein NC177_02650 [Ruminococcus flavefaciens]|nr:hypothetical protein [Ruminococcus flavefaciens]